jgi:phosphatidylglycerophosphate synthase
MNIEKKAIAYYLVNGLTMSRSFMMYAALAVDMVTGNNDIPKYLLWANIGVDIIDGKLARHFGVTSPEGRMLDITGDCLVIGGGIGLAFNALLPERFNSVGAVATAVSAVLAYPFFVDAHNRLHKEDQNSDEL